MMITITDPVPRPDAREPRSHTRLLESDDGHAIKIHAEPAQTNKQCRDHCLEHPGEDFTIDLNQPQ